MPVEEDVGREQRRRVLQTVVWFLLTLLLALFIPDIGKVISIIGGLAACFIFVFPGVDPWRPRSTASLPARAPHLLPAGERSHQPVWSPATGSGLTPGQAPSDRKMLFSPLPDEEKGGS
ncbi:Putative sodium-coupled neutral amino acid transporter 7 [Myotis brandtii]|uniref:Putative sodium-coupled neutral amino acid transporter 7 n=1 Tax=Myotis brandtii TaxID=109478 RepID=S7NSA4_MYOBR|nr:Putative sodium-coupled neutral amino acid transporter 7 [Myotis brandtii]